MKSVAEGLRIGPIELEWVSGRCARVRIGDPQAKQTILDEEAIRSLEKMMQRLEALISLRGVVFAGCAPGRFIAGADLAQIEGVVDPAEGERLSARGQALFHRIFRMPWNTVAAIDGPCLGGGLELALACKVLVATDSPATRLALPEVRLGIVPGWGGTQRLPRRIGLTRGLQWILTGRSFDARAAERAGVVDRVVPREMLDAVTLEAADGVAVGTRRRARPLGARLLDGTSPGRAIVAAMARKRVLAETGGRYPAPLRAIDVAARGLSTSLEKGLALEARALGETIASPVSKELVRLFRLSEAPKKTADRAGAERIERAEVVGAGVMGAAIAQLFAEKGIATRLRDTRAPALAEAIGRAARKLEKRVRERRMTETEARAIRDRLQPTTDGSGLARCQVVVEAIVEDLGAKRALLAEVAAAAGATALLATNTSSLSVGDLQEGVPRPERVVGLHFFNPVEKMPLVEVVRGSRTSAESVALAAGLALRLGKTPVVVADRPGFLVNRILAPYLAEAARLLADGLSIPEIDGVARAEGMPMGPFELLDEVGLDVAAAAARTLEAAFGDRMRAGDLLGRLLAVERVGKKGGAGFRRHTAGARPRLDPAAGKILGIAWASEARGPRSAEILPEAGDRLLLALHVEACRALREGVAATADEIDLAAVFGIGYPPWRGGPLRDGARRGPALRERLRDLAARYGERFALPEENEPCTSN